jgi:hypothetical protein
MRIRTQGSAIDFGTQLARECGVDRCIDRRATWQINYNFKVRL